MVPGDMRVGLGWWPCSIYLFLDFFTVLSKKKILPRLMWAVCSQQKMVLQKAQRGDED